MSLSRTQAGIVGAGPAGLPLGRLLELSGVESVIIEQRSREYVENRMRAGMMQHRSRPSIPAAALTTWSRDYPFAWLGVVAEVAPSTVELIYACHERGFALQPVPRRGRRAHRAAHRGEGPQPRGV